MGVEIERKYLVNKAMWETAAKGDKQFYQQGYLLADPAKTIRVRLGNEEGYITIKGQSVGATRLEYEYPIPKEDAKELLDTFCTSVVSKYRYRVYVGEKLWEVDEFLDDNEGLMVAEIELVHEQETFQLPVWVAQEVTGERKYYNSNLAVHPYKSWNE
jgi:CYTH domain-containing protein